MGAKTSAPKVRIKTGTYTGDGNATQVITGIGFQPDCVVIVQPSDVHWWIKLEGMGPYSQSGAAGYVLNRIISFDSDGFTIGNNSGLNTLGQTNFYFAFRKT